MTTRILLSTTSCQDTAGGLLLTLSELESFAEIAAECGHPAWDTGSLEAFAV